MIFAAAFCGFFYSSKLFYESLVSKKRAHRFVYQVRATSANDVRLMRRANVLGLAGMLLLFILAYGVLVTLVANNMAGSISYPDCYGFTAPVSSLPYISGTLFGFSFALVIVASSYPMFKRVGAKAAPALLLVAISAALASL